MGNFICQHFTEEHKRCYCGKETIGITLEGFKPIHKGENEELIICAPQFKEGEFVRLKIGGGYGHCKTGDIVQIYHRTGLDSYDVLKGGNAWSNFTSSDFEKVDVPEYYNHRHRLIPGCVFMNGNKKYVVENAESGWDASGSRMGFEGEDGTPTWKVEARELKNGEYDNAGELIKFIQGGEIEVIGFMEKEIKFTAR